MKQKAAIEKSYAEGLLKLSSVFGSKKVAAKVGFIEQTNFDFKSCVLLILILSMSLTFFLSQKRRQYIFNFNKKCFD